MLFNKKYDRKLSKVKTIIKVKFEDTLNRERYNVTLEQLAIMKKKDMIFSALLLIPKIGLKPL